MKKMMKRREWENESEQTSKKHEKKREKQKEEGNKKGHGGEGKKQRQFCARSMFYLSPWSAIENKICYRLWQTVTNASDSKLNPNTVFGLRHDQDFRYIRPLTPDFLLEIKIRVSTSL